MITDLPVASPPRPREASKEKTRDELILAGIAEFAQHGFDAPSLDAICARAGRTRGAFYVHFRDRDDFMLAVVERVLGTVLDAIIDTDDQEQNLAHTVRRFVELVTLYQTAARAGGLPAAPAPDWHVLALHRVLEACSRSEPLRLRFTRIIQDAIERVAAAAAEGQRGKAIRGDASARALATLLVALAIGATVALETGVDFDAGSAGEALLTLLTSH